MPLSKAHNLKIIEDNRVQDRPALEALLRNQLSHEQWAAVMPPLYTKEVNFNRWGKFEWQICCKWLARNTTGWWYWDKDSWLVFEKLDDHVLFTLWAKNEPMAADGSRNVQIS